MPGDFMAEGTYGGCLFALFTLASYPTKFEKLKFDSQIELKNNNEKFSGRKVTGIELFNSNSNILMVSTNDSRIRFINISNGRNIID